MKHLKRKPFPRHVIKTVTNDHAEIAGTVIAIFCLVLLIAWFQKDDEKHKAVDQSYAEETRKDMKAQSDAQKRAAKFDELQAESNTYTGHAGIKP